MFLLFRSARGYSRGCAAAAAHHAHALAHQLGYRLGKVLGGHVKDGFSVFHRGRPALGLSNTGMDAFSNSSRTTPVS